MVTDVPSVFPFQQRSSLQLVSPQLKYAALGVWRRGREKGKFLTELRFSRVQVRNHLLVGSTILCRPWRAIIR